MFQHKRLPLDVLRAASTDETVKRDKLERRSDSRQITTIVIASILVGVVFFTVLYFAFRATRYRRRNSKTKRVSFLKQVWGEWRPGGSQSAYEQASGEDGADADSGRRRASARGSVVAEHDASAEPNSRNENSAVDRHTSVRSIMTLPAYRPKPSNTEQVLGREGERDGVDTVVEFPTAEDLENLREEEMETLYQIRLARRQEIADREERRRQRREARQNNDVVALEEIRSRTRAASNNSMLEELRRDHDRAKNQRQRAVSSVAYGDLGVARHDGTRIRANSTESERVGLLSDAASIAAVSTNSRSASSLYHRRERSASSVMSIDSDFPSPGLTRSGSTRSRANSRTETPRLSGHHDRAGSSPELVEADVGDSDMPPPGYEDVSLDEGRSGATTPQPTEPPPDYPGPSQQRAERVATDMADLGQSTGPSDDRRSSRGVGGVPQLPSLRLQRLPQIVIEPSSAYPRDNDG